MSQGGILSVASSPSVPIQFTTDSGIAVPSGNNLNIFGGTGITTTGSGDTVTISVDGTGSVSSITGTANQVLANGTTGVPQVGAVTLTTPQDIGLTSDVQFNSLTLITPLTVPNGGTGASTFTAYSVICAGTTATGVFQNVSGLGSSGQVLTSQGAASLPQWTSISSLGVSSITGTANQVLVNGTSGTPQIGAVTLTTPQDIATTSTPTFLATSGNVQFTLGTNADAITDTKTLEVVSNGYVRLNLYGDRGNDGTEPGGVLIRLSVDGLLNNTRIGLPNQAGGDGSSGGTLTGTVAGGLYLSSGSTLSLGGNTALQVTLTSSAFSSTVPIFAPVGASVGDPSYTFIGDPDTGVTSTLANTLNLVTGGSSRASVTTTFINTTVPVSVNSGTTAASPGFQFSQTGNGMYLVGANNVGFSTNSTLRVSLSTTAVAISNAFLQMNDNPIYASGSGTASTTYGLGFNQWGASGGVYSIFSADKINFQYTQISNTIRGFVDCANGFLRMNSGSYFSGALGAVNIPVYQLDFASSTGLGIYASASNNFSIAVNSNQFMNMSRVTDSDIYVPHAYNSTRFTTLLDGTTSDNSGGILLETGSTDTGNAGGRIMISESSYVFGMSWAYNGGTTGDWLGLPTNTGALIFHNGTDAGLVRLGFPRANRFVGINVAAPAYVLDVQDMTDSTARIGLLSTQANSDIKLRTNSTSFGFESQDDTYVAVWQQSTGYLGIGSNVTATKRVHLANAAGNENSLWIQNTGDGFTDTTGTNQAIWLTSNAMSTTLQYTPQIVFGSTDSAFTTQNPKSLAGILGVATETYSGDSDSGMAVAILSSPQNAGTSGTREEVARFDANPAVGFNLSKPITMGSSPFYNEHTIQWQATNVGGSNVDCVWVNDDVGLNTMPQYMAVEEGYLNVLTMCVDATATGSVIYTFTVTNATQATSTTAAVGITAASTAGRSTFVDPLHFNQGDILTLQVRVSTGTPVNAELGVQIKGWQFSV